MRWGLVRCERAAQYPQEAHGGTQTPGQTPLPGPPTAGTGAPTDMPRRSHLTSPLQCCKLHRLGGSACRFYFFDRASDYFGSSPTGHDSIKIDHNQARA